MSKPTIDISIVMPVLNESEVLPSTVQDLVKILENESFEIVLVDDGSTDDTWEIIEALASQFTQVGGLHFTRNFGHQSALLAGISYARGKAVITMDSDGEHPPALIPDLIKSWRRGAKVVQMVREDINADSFFKRFTSRSFYKLFSWLSGTHLRPGSSDFRLLDKTVVDLVLDHPRASRFLRGFVPWSGFHTVFLEYTPGQRQAGKTKFSSKRMFGLARDGILRFSVKPLRLSLLIGALTCAGSIAYLFYVLIIRLFFGNQTEPGWASVAGLLSFLGGIQLLVIGVLGEYLGIIFETINESPRFIISGRCGSQQLKRKPTRPPPIPPSCG
ncbi:MAG: glycosyltransferase family 2 protein [Myxococcota bacterium]|nr:glycosyltransferase family 2 protein [Myxococcota bacterium]